MNNKEQIKIKTLHLLRHAKSSWEMPGISDIDRQLLEKGIINAYYIAERFKSRFPNPDLIISSPANRAIHTALIFCRKVDFNITKLKLDARIYEASSSELIDIIEETPEHINSLLLVGHNPGFTDVPNLFISDHIENLATSGLVSLHFESRTWNIIDKTAVHFEIDFPKKEYF